MYNFSFSSSIFKKIQNFQGQILFCLSVFFFGFNSFKQLRKRKKITTLIKKINDHNTEN